MKRINIYDDEKKFQGWFDHDAATEIAAIKNGNPYIYGRILLATAKNKLVVNDWSNTGTDSYRFANDESEIAEILAGAEWDGEDLMLDEILKKYEI